MNAPATAVTAIASGTSLPTVQRSRPMPWVQAYRKVPVSSSLASTGAPMNAPISTGTTCRAMLTRIALSPYLPVKLMPQASEPAGWQ